jgi:transcriptional regulator with PAS, ATPase and Fis domain
MGAKDFIQKGKLDWSEWKNRILNYCADYRKIRFLEQESQKLKKEHNKIIGNSDKIVYLKRKLKDLALHSNESSILITGETGTGKNLSVQYFRNYSKRNNKPYQEFSITEKSETVLESELFGHKQGAFTGANYNKKGLFEAADGGILFLDEIGDYSLEIQSKILRFLEDKTITPVGATQSKALDVQLIMATNKDLKKLIEKKKLRKDLYYRIDRIRVHIPPLRDRKEDIKVLADHFFYYYRKRENTNLLSISDEVYELFRGYSWPGNVRELQSVILKACSDARLYDDKKLQKKHVIHNLDIEQNEQSEITFSNYREKMDKIELEMIDKALEQTYGQKTKAAELLGMSADNMRYRVVSSKDKSYINNFKNITKYYLKDS